MDCSLNFLSRLEWRLRNYFIEDPILKDFVDDPYFWSGQHIRAKICQQVGEALGIEEDLLLDIAAFTELLHNASLIHDDLIDNDSERRGCETPWKKYGKSKAILLGDLLIARSMSIATLAKTNDTIRSSWASEISKCVASAVHGAFRELDFSSLNAENLLSNYTEMSHDKTGVMFALPARCAVIASSDLDCIDPVTEIFTNLAIAYQIRDDQADFLCVKKGRTNPSDLKNNRPNIYHILENSHSIHGCHQEFIEDFQHDLISKSLILVNQHLPESKPFFEEVILPFINLDKPIQYRKKRLGNS
ncbi:MAG: polyprenyl synthetase family protein [Verrucomicrobiota bacterium]|nr:polyprenyl synthetase family protein [Verrucomicrobiota bacterium]